MSPKRVERAAAEMLSEIGPDHMPHWFSVVLVRVFVAMIVIVFPICVTAAGAWAWNQTTATSQLQYQVTSLTKAVADQTAATRKLIDTDMAGFDKRLSAIETRGILPEAEKRLDKLERTFSDEITSVKGRLTVAPSDVKAEVQASRAEFLAEIEKLHKRLDKIQADDDAKP